jgi:hypothetical protein
MSKELIENLRDYADIAETDEKSHWALAMRQAAEYIKADLGKPLAEPVLMTNANPTTPGWYWYELPGSWPLQPVLVFDGGPGYGLMYALDKIDLDHDDGNRDGFCIDICNVNSLWSTRPIESPNKEVAIGAEK